MNQLWKGIVCLTSFTLITGFSIQPAQHDRSYYEARKEVVWEVPMDDKLIALTFDDGPNLNTTPQILDLLEKYNAKATFFVVGNRLDKYADIIKREALEGHEVANHTYNHVFFTRRVGESVIVKEILDTQKKIMELTGQETKWFRPPGGYYNDRVVNVARENGFTIIMWSWHQDTNDWNSPGVDRIVNKVLRNARNGDIVLMHDNVSGSTQTVRALERILPALQEQGYRMVTVSELMGHKTKVDIPFVPEP